MSVMFGQKPRVFNPRPDATKESENGKCDRVREKYVGGSHLPMLLGCKVGPTPRLGGSTKWYWVLSVVKLVCRLWGMLKHSLSVFNPSGD